MSTDTVRTWLIVSFWVASAGCGAFLGFIPAFGRTPGLHVESFYLTITFAATVMGSIAAASFAELRDLAEAQK